MRSGENEHSAGSNRNEEIYSPETLWLFQMMEQFYQCGETSTMSGHKRKGQEKETLSEVQPTEIQNNNPEGQAAVEAIEGNNIPNSITVEHFYQCGETSTMSGHKRKRQEKETLSEVQPTEMLNNNPEGQATVETIVGDNIPISVTVHDAVDHPTHVVAQPSPELISTPPLNSDSSIENAKRVFNNLIALPLEDLINPKNEISMNNAFSILKNHYSLFSEELAEQIVELSVEFSLLVHNWRLYSEYQMYSQKFSAEAEKIRNLVENSVRDEEILKVRYEELENKDKELMRQLEAVQKEKAEIAEQGIQKSKQTKDLMEKEAHQVKDERLMRIATSLLNNLSDQWAEIQSFFT